MTSPSRAIVAIAFLVAMTASPVRAARAYDSCTAFISSLPAVLASPGTWCLQQDLATSLASGYAITIGTNNVTIDCNGFKVGGLAAGPDTLAVGIVMAGKSNTTIRDCGIRGFHQGIRIVDASAYEAVVEDNRLDGNTFVAVNLAGNGHIVRRNRILDTGGKPVPRAINNTANRTSISENVVAGVAPGATDSDAAGILTTGYGNVVARNSISGVIPTGAGIGVGISTGNSSQNLIQDNRIFAAPGTAGWGIVSTFSNLCGGNRIIGYDIPIDECSDAGNNVSD